MSEPTVVRCGNPSCAAHLEVPAHIPVADAMRLARWGFATELGDDVERPYCRRCLTP